MSADDNDEEPKRLRLKWLDGTNHENARQAKKHENRLAERLGGKRYPGSGNKPLSRRTYRKTIKGEKMRTDLVETEATDCGDFSNDDFHFEHKFTRDASTSVKLEWLDKMEEGARIKRKHPALVLTFQDNQGRPKKEYVAMPLSVYEQLVARAKKGNL